MSAVSKCVITEDQKCKRAEYNQQYRKSLSDAQKNLKRERDRLYRFRKKQTNNEHAKCKRDTAERNHAYRLRKKMHLH